MSDDADDADSASGNGEGGETVNVDYIKSPLFRTLSPSGLIASVTPQGRVQIGLYSERQALPRRVVHKIEQDGSLGDMVEIFGRDAIVRELDAVVTFERETAAQLAHFLTDFVSKQVEDGETEQ